MIPLRLRTSLVLALTSALGVVAFIWPLLVQTRTVSGGSAELAHAADAPWVFVVLLPLLLAVVLAELADGRLDAKAVALLGVLAAVGAVLRLPSTGVAGVELVFFLLIPAGRVFGRGFGFVLGALTLFASALLTGGVGPWLPFQMFAAAWVGFGAGCLPPARGRRELALLVTYGAVAGLAYGLVMNLWFWPFGAQAGSAIAFVPGAGLGENLGRFWAFHLATSLGWDLPRAVTNVVLMVAFGSAVLAALRRVARRAAFGVPVTFAGEPAVEVEPGSNAPQVPVRSQAAMVSPMGVAGGPSTKGQISSANRRQSPLAPRSPNSA
jgi:energy-coupling factor transport system substrate-specific component